MAKIRGYAPWPGKINQILKNQMEIEFFGVSAFEKIGFVKNDEVALFRNCAELIPIILKTFKRNSPNQLKFQKALKEVELLCRLPDLKS